MIRAQRGRNSKGEEGGLCGQTSAYQFGVMNQRMESTKGGKERKNFDGLFVIRNLFVSLHFRR